MDILNKQSAISTLTCLTTKKPQISTRRLNRITIKPLKMQIQTYHSQEHKVNNKRPTPESTCPSSSPLPIKPSPFYKGTPDTPLDKNNPFKNKNTNKTKIRN